MGFDIVIDSLPPRLDLGIRPMRGRQIRFRWRRIRPIQNPVHMRHNFIVKTGPRELVPKNPIDLRKMRMRFQHVGISIAQSVFG